MRFHTVTVTLTIYHCAFHLIIYTILCLLCRFVSESRLCEGGESQAEVREPSSWTVYRKSHGSQQCVPEYITQNQEEVSKITSSYSGLNIQSILIAILLRTRRRYELSVFYYRSAAKKKGAQ